MGASSNDTKVYPSSGLFNYDEINEKVIINAIEKVNF